MLTIRLLGGWHFPDGHRGPRGREDDARLFSGQRALSRLGIGDAHLRGYHYDNITLPGRDRRGTGRHRGCSVQPGRPRRLHWKHQMRGDRAEKGMARVTRAE